MPNKPSGPKTSDASAIWGGRFDAGPSEVMSRINASIDFDKRLYAQDIRASKAHCEMLVRQKIIAAADGAAVDIVKEHRRAQELPGARDREQVLHAGDVPDADREAALMLVNLGDTLRFDGLLDAEAYAVLVDVEEQKLLQRCALVDR